VAWKEGKTSYKLEENLNYSYSFLKGFVGNLGVIMDPLEETFSKDSNSQRNTGWGKDQKLLFYYGKVGPFCILDPVIFFEDFKGYPIGQLRPTFIKRAWGGRDFQFFTLFKRVPSNKGVKFLGQKLPNFLGGRYLALGV